MRSIGAAGPEPLRWFAFHTRARHEKGVERLLRRQGLEVFLPMVSRLRQWKDRRKMVEFPMFPGYVFARCPPEQLSLMTALPGIAGVVRQGGHAAPVADEDLENVRHFTRKLRSADQEPEVVPLPGSGTEVRITSGPLAGLTGLVSEHRGSSVVLIGIRTLGQGMVVRVPGSAIEVVADEE